MVEHISSFKLMYFNKKLCFSINFYLKTAAFSLIDSYILSVRKNYENSRQAWAKCLIILSQTSKLMVEHISSFKLKYINKKLCFSIIVYSHSHLYKIQTFCKKKLWKFKTSLGQMLNYSLSHIWAYGRTHFKL